MKPDWTLIANATRARLLQRERGGTLVLLESFIHPCSRGDRNAIREHTEFARELAHLLEQEAQLDHFRSLTIFAAQPLVQEIRNELGQATRRRLTSIREQDVTSCALVELEQRMAREAAPGDLIH